MERNRWDTAIRCLEVALHPNTQDGEVIAAVNGFRRAAAGTPLREVCFQLAGAGPPGRSRADAPEKWKEALDRLNRENLDLRRKLEVEESTQAAARRRLREAEERVRDLHRALDQAKRNLAELQAERTAPPPFRKMLAAALSEAPASRERTRATAASHGTLGLRKSWTA